MRSIRENDTHDMDRALFSRLLREMREAGVEELGLFYINEPFLSTWLDEAIVEAQDVGFPYVFLTTNGSAITPRKLKACMAAGLDSLKFSVNCADASQFSEITGASPALYVRALANIAVARAIRDSGHFPCRIYASSIQFDGEQGKRMRQVVERHVLPHVDQWYELPLYGMSGAGGAVGKPQPGNPGRVGALVPPLPCWSAFQEGHITADGKLSACCFGNGADDALAMADLTTSSFLDGWNSAAFQALRSAHLAEDVSGTPCAACLSAPTN